MEDIDQIILEPAKAYREVYKEKFAKNTNDLFNKLVKESNISIEDNRKNAQTYRNLSKELEEKKKNLEKTISSRKASWITIGFGIAFIILGALSALIPFIIMGSILVVMLLIFIFAVFNKKIKTLQFEVENFDKRVKKAYQEAMNSIIPLLDLFDSSITNQLIQQTVPTLKIDKNFDMKRYDYLNGKYGLKEDSGPEISTLGIMSGEIVGNPFIFETKLVHSIGTETYTGEKQIEWTTVERDADGHIYHERHTQILRASVQKPKPFFHENTTLTYGNDAAPNLTFSREATHYEKLSESKKEKFVKSYVKKIRKMEKKNLETGFTSMGNEEFDAIFGALDRNNEIEFRLLFTPLAQKNILDLVKEGSPFGDDFEMTKIHCLNIIKSEHSQNWNINTDSNRYFTYDIDICYETFTKINNKYFESMFFDFAPLLSIPLYQQNKPKEYIYKQAYDRCYTVRESEVLANKLRICHPDAVTPSIIKTDIDYTEFGVDHLIATAYSYKTIDRVDYVSVWGNDGRMHKVPVHWDEYIPISKTSKIQLGNLDLNEHQYRHSKFDNTNSTHAFYHSIYATAGEMFKED